MVNRQVLKNQRLEVTIRLPGSQPESERFDSSCVVERRAYVLPAGTKNCFEGNLLGIRAECRI